MMATWRRILGKIGQWQLWNLWGRPTRRADGQARSYDFAHVFADELNAVEAPSPHGVSHSTPAASKPGDEMVQLDEVVQRAHASKLTGLAFSGGGIRSATFNLGVLQGLADMRLLQKFHYLSTVSGGGYIGSWLTAWLYRRGCDDVVTRLRPNRREQPGGTEPPEIRFLRQYSNYLTPVLGWFGADTWTLIAIYLRNLILNLILLVAMFAAMLLIPRGVIWLASAVSGEHYGWALVLMFLTLLCSGIYIVANLRFFMRRPTTMAPEPHYTDLLDEEHKHQWQTPTGPDVTLPLKDDILTLAPEQPVFYREKLTSFIFTTQFRLDGSHACTDILVKATDDEDTTDGTATEYAIRIANGDRPSKESLGAIVGIQAPMAFVLKPGGAWNDLEVRCAQHVYTVRLNGRTINTFHGKRHKQRQLGLSRGSAPDAVQFRHMLLRELPIPAPYYTLQSYIQWRIVLPLFAAALFGTALLGPERHSQTSASALWRWALVAGVGFVVIYGLSKLLLDLWQRVRQSQTPATPAGSMTITDVLKMVLWSILAGALGGVLLYGLKQFVSSLALGAAVVWGPPLGIGIVMLVLVVFIGLMGDAYSDEIHEWWSRLSAWLLIYALVWIGVFGTALYSPPVLNWLAEIAVALGFGWVVSTVGGIFAAKSAESNQRNAKPWVEWLASVAPYIFVIGLVAGLAWGVDAVLTGLSGHQATSSTLETATPQRSVTIRIDLPEHETAQAQDLPVSAHMTPADPQQQPSSLQDRLAAHWDRIAAQHQPWFVGLPVLFWLFLLVGAIMLFFSWRLDINRFSMHQFYRNRLARCYLGASNDMPRTPQPFTGFDPNDDITLADIGYRSHLWQPEKPYLIINAVLNLVGGHELAWQQRKAASFVFTPRYCGYDFPELPPGFCQTNEYACQPLPVTLAMAMAISGAAASPNMGYHSSPAPMFLMTVFNVRLGWWLGNPRHPQGRQFSSPTHVLWHLIKEMFGLTNEAAKFIYLSDGGHFENLGIYELVRRRCRFIVACDAEQDQHFGFSGLGNAIEKCRADLGIDIDIDVEPIRQRDASGHSQWHCAIGRIRYDTVDANAPQGTLVYIKSSLTGDEPTDVLRYAAQHTEFPHQSTADQWFDESQFESYRTLGYHAVKSVFGAVDALEKLHGRTSEQLFVELRQRWFPPAQAHGNFSKHTTALAALYERLRTIPDLYFLSSQMYPEWPVLLRNMQPPPRANQLPQTVGEIRQGFYFCNALIQLMEDVYLDLVLEQEYDHPDNRGWMNLFRHWSWAPTFRVTWIISAATYGARFQSFCERHLGLRLGQVSVQRPGLKAADLAAGNGLADTLNEVERSLLRRFFDLHEGLQEAAQILPLQITAAEKVTEAGGALEFTFGFVVLHDNRIVYFRVQDHLRTMGLGRRALAMLMEQEHLAKRPLTIDLKEMPLDTEETLSAKDRTAFSQMFRALELELQLMEHNSFTVRKDFNVGLAVAQAAIMWPNLTDWIPEDVLIHMSNFEPSPLEHQLQFTWCSTEARNSYVTMQCEGDAHHTTVRITHTMIPNQELCAHYRHSWLRCLDNLPWPPRDSTP